MICLDLRVGVCLKAAIHSANGIESSSENGKTDKHLRRQGIEPCPTAVMLTTTPAPLFCGSLNPSLNDDWQELALYSPQARDSDSVLLGVSFNRNASDSYALGRTQHLCHSFCVADLLSHSASAYVLSRQSTLRSGTATYAPHHV